MANEIKISRFTGMNNLSEEGNLFVGKETAQPRIILNADVDAQGRLTKRDGFTKQVNLTAPHSLWGGVTALLCVSQGALYQIEGSVATSMGTVLDAGRMSYAEVDGLIYMSNIGWNGVFDPDAGSISTWGISLPNGPVLSSTTGSLAAGTYHVCITTESGDEISGNGPISRITLSSEGGISISNRSSDGIVWCTDPNGDVFYRIGKVNAITNIVSVEPLPSLFCSPPPFVAYLTHAFGRMWGAIGNKVYYSEPFKWSWWKLGTSFFEYATDVTMIAKTKTGLFIGCEDRTYFHMGSKPEEMQQFDVGSGAIPGTLSYVNNIIELGDTISPPEKKHESVPVWVCEEGIVAGNPAGRLFSLSQGKVKFAPGTEGASLYRQKNGDLQFLTSFLQGEDTVSMGLADEATITVIRNGTVIAA
jgi:hypothetical protein